MGIGIETYTERNISKDIYIYIYIYIYRERERERERKRERTIEIFNNIKMIDIETERKRETVRRKRVHGVR